MRDIMRGEQQEHAHSMDDIVIPLLDDRRTQVLPHYPPILPQNPPTSPLSLHFIRHPTISSFCIDPPSIAAGLHDSYN